MLQRLYDAASPSHLRPSRGGVHSANATMDITGDKLRQLSRYLDENHDIATGVLDDLLSNVVGAGRVPTPMVRLTDGSLAKETNRRLSEQWGAWAERPEVTQSYGMCELERLTFRSMLRDGEVFVRLHRSRFPFPSPTRLALQPLEADFVPFDLTRSDRIGVVHGVELDTWNRPIAYHTLTEHPGDFHLARGRVHGETRRVRASNMWHLKFVRRLHQIRGVPIFHAALNRLRDVHDYEESERIAARVAAELTAYIKRSGEFRGVIDDSKRLMNMQSGAVFELLPGEDVGTIQSNRPNTGLSDFRSAMLRAVAAGTGTRYSSIARDYNGTYSAQRQELVEASIHYRALFQMMVDKFYRPLWREFIEATPVRAEMGVDRATLTRVDWRPPALPWIDPVKEANAWKVLLDAQLESRAEIIRSRGRDPEKVREELERERAELPTPRFDAPDDDDGDEENEDEDAA